MTAPLQIQLDQTSFQPGDTLTGKLRWTADASTEKIALRLFYFTEGRGTQDIECVDEQEWDCRSAGEQDFQFTLPAMPYSFSGELISLQWALEAVTLPKEKHNTRQIFTLSLNGEEVILQPISTPHTGKKKKSLGSKK